MPDMRISEDTVLLIARLANEAEDMKDAANEALKSAWSDYRESLKSLKLTGKEISAEVGQLKAAIAEVRLTETDRDKRENKAEGIDGYVAILRAPRARARRGSNSTAQNFSNSGADSAKTAPAVTTPEITETQPAPQAVPELGADTEMLGVEHPNTEPQPPVSAGSDLAASPANDDGQVADIQPETANESTDASQERAQTATGTDTSGDNLDSGSRPTATAKTDVPSDQGQASGGGQSQDNSGVRVASVETLYAPKGETVWELTPPEGVIRHEYSQAFGEAGQDIAVIEDDMANAASAPIVKIGNVILDGWARYLKARELGIEYPVEQYAGTDSLMDCIKWNTGGRMMTSEQSFRIAQRLAKAEPKRKADIYAAFELGMALA